jgi:methylmalonyl-CoA carboxyltransferase large subunit
VSTDELKDGTAQPTVAELLARIEELTRRVEWLEAGRSDGPQVPTDLPPDVVLAISAAVAAYLGKRAKVRAIHLSDSATWAQQGRASIMGSHTVTHRRAPGSGHRSFR